MGWGVVARHAGSGRSALLHQRASGTHVPANCSLGGGATGGLVAGAAGVGAGGTAGSVASSSLCQSGARRAVGAGPPAQPAKAQTATTEKNEKACEFDTLALCKCATWFQAS